MKLVIKILVSSLCHSIQGLATVDVRLCNRLVMVDALVPEKLRIDFGSFPNVTIIEQNYLEWNWVEQNLRSFDLIITNPEFRIVSVTLVVIAAVMRLTGRARVVTPAYRLTSTKDIGLLTEHGLRSSVIQNLGRPDYTAEGVKRRKQQADSIYLIQFEENMASEDDQ